MTAAQLRPNTAQLVLLAGAAICYAVGYPVALVADSAVGWILVTLGGVFLIALGIVTVRRIHNSTADGAAGSPSLPDASVQQLHD